LTASAPKNLQWMDAADRSPRGSFLRALTAAVEPFYTLAVSLRNKAYDAGLFRTHRLDVPVVSVGNITTGGTGKTPMVVYVVNLLQAAGRRPAVILRGYKATIALGSDEQRLLAESLPGVPVIANPDRRAAARLLRRDHPEADVVVLDDAFQHRRIHRNLDLVLIDATRPFGFDHVLPRGLLRESVAGLRRASAIVVTHANALPGLELVSLTERLKKLSDAPVVWFDHVWGRVVDQTNKPVQVFDLNMQRLWATDRPRLVAFCGIGNPGPFFDTAAQHMTLADRRTFPDHHAYTAADLEALLHRAVELDADALLTTQKDWVKLRSLVNSRPLDRPIWRPELRVEWCGGSDSPDALDRLIVAATRRHKP
jgi:tetraacyldisaccharide 4'-kinase